MRPITHKIEWSVVCNDQVSICVGYGEIGSSWSLGSKMWKYVDCKRCLKILDKRRAEAGIKPRKKREST